MPYRKPTKLGGKKIKGGFAADRKTGPQVRGLVPRFGSPPPGVLMYAMLRGQAKRKEKQNGEA